MRAYKAGLYVLGAITMNIAMGTSSFAGGCGNGLVCNNSALAQYEGTGQQQYSHYGASPCSGATDFGHSSAVKVAAGCSPTFIDSGDYADPLADIHSVSHRPFGYLKSFVYKNTPNENITRVHGRAPLISLSDAPREYRAGCLPAPKKTGAHRAPRVNTIPCRSAPPPITAVPVPYPVQVRVPVRVPVAVPVPQYPIVVTPRPYVAGYVSSPRPNVGAHGAYDRAGQNCFTYRRAPQCQAPRYGKRTSARYGKRTSARYGY